jgi:Cysteine-rich secretory protein family
MYRKVSIKVIMILVTAAILTVPSSMLQVSHAQSTKALQDVLAIHNRERADVRNQPLTWSNSLADQAQGYADQLKSQGYVCNNSNDNLNVCKPGSYLPHGANNENLAWGSVGFPIDQLVQGPRYSWVIEKSGYNAQTNTCTPDMVTAYTCGHYTAMIWGGTREVGCGTSSGAEIVILVCRYNPPGNMAGQTPFSQGAAQAVGEEDSTLAPPPQEGVGGGGGGDTSGGGGGGDTSGGGGGGDTSGGGGGNDN